MSRNRSGEWVGHLWCWGGSSKSKRLSPAGLLPRGRAAARRDCTRLPEGDFYGATVVISKHKFFHVPNIVEGSNSAPVLVIVVSVGQECPGNLSHPK